MLFDRTAPELIAIAAHLAGDRDRAEELVQSTFLAAIEGVSRFDPSRPVMPWLVGILTKLAHKQRSRAARQLNTPDLDLVGGPDPVAAAEERELVAALQAARDGLHDPYRQVLELHLDHGLTGGEIADILRQPASRVRTQLARGLEMLRKRLPRGLTAGLAVAAVPAASLHAMRATILARAADAVPATAGTVLGLGIGVTIMHKKTSLIAAAALALLAIPLGLTLADGSPQSGETPLPVDPMQASAPPKKAAELAEAAVESGALRTAVAPPSQVEPTRGAVTVALSWKRSGDPAAQQGVHIGLYKNGNAHLYARSALTDEAGTCTFADLSPGRWFVYLGLGGSQRVDVAAGAVRRVDLEVERRGTAEGIVVDAEGQPVADARIWLSNTATWKEGFEATRAGDDGRFEVPIGRNHYIGARKAGHLPSLLRDADAKTPGQTLTFRLDLRGPAGRVTGTVLDPTGRPCGGARVWVGSEFAFSRSSLTDDERLTMPAGRPARTTEDGTFAIDGVEPGSVRVQAGAPGFAPWQGEVVVAASGQAHVEVQLEPGAVVRGRAFDARRQPVPEAWVMHGRSGDLAARATRADGDGWFELDSLPAGNVTLEARAKERGKVRETVQLAAGSITEWNPVLTRGRTIAGTVLDPHGKPLARASVTSWEPPHALQPTGHATTDQHGRFELANLEVELHNLRVIHPKSDRACLERHGVRVGGPDVVLQLTEDHVPSVRVRGRLVDSDGNAITDAQILAARPGASSSPMYGVDAETGAIELGPWPPGTYQLSVRAVGFGLRTLGVHRLAAHQELDLGAIQLEAPGSVRLQVIGADGQPAPQGYVTLYDDDGQQVGNGNAADGELVIDSIAPGTYVTQLHLDLRTFATTSVTVASGEEARAELRVQATSSVRLTITAEAEASTLGMVSILVRNDARRLVCTAWANEQDGEITRELHLPPGTYVLEARAGTAGTASGQIVVPALGSPPGEATLALQ